MQLAGFCYGFIDDVSLRGARRPSLKTWLSKVDVLQAEFKWLDQQLS